MIGRRIVGCLCAATLILAICLRWEKTTATKELTKLVYLRDRWLGQSYVQSWGAAAFGGDGKGSVLPVFSQTTEEYYYQECTEADKARQLRYSIVTGAVDPTRLTEKGIKILESHGYSVGKMADPEEAKRLSTEIQGVKDHMQSDREANAIAWRGIATGVWVVGLVAVTAVGLVSQRRSKPNLGKRSR